MPGYVERALQRFAHPAPSRPEHSPHEWQEPQYGRKVQYAPDPDTTPPLDKDLIKRVQAISGVLLFYSRQVDPTILMALSEISTQQAKPTAKTMDKVVKLLNYLATHPDASVRFVASDMVLWTDSDASYLTAPKARSRAGGYHFLSSKPPNGRAPTNDDPPPPDNGAVLVLCKIMREVLSSAAEAESGGLFLNGKEAVPIRITLEELGHEQPPTPLQTDNNTASGIANDDVKQKRSKAMDMRFYWVRDRVRQGQFHVFWRRGVHSRADYFTKHFPPSYHREIRPKYLHEPKPVATKNRYSVLTDIDEEPDDDHSPPPVFLNQV